MIRRSESEWESGWSLQFLKNLGSFDNFSVWNALLKTHDENDRA